MSKTKRMLPIFLCIVVVCLLGILLFGCMTSNEQQLQITNAFTPGKTEKASLQPLTSEDHLTQTETAVFSTEAQTGTASLPSIQPTIIITNTQGLPFIVTQTRAVTQPNQPANTATATQNPATSTATKTATLTPSPTIQPGWEGDWKAYFEKTDGSFTTGTLQVSVDVTSLTATLNIDNIQYVFNGIVINEGKYATGSWLGGASQGSFWWNLIGGGQFRGCHTDQFALCGSRAGLNQPEPCRELPRR